MKTRMEKYYDEESQNINLRQQKNEKLYENIGNLPVDDYKLETNVTVLDNNAKNIDVEQIKKILDTRYNKAPKRRSIIIEEAEEEPNIDLEETREYDINAILERARSEKEVDYEQERLKKIRDTQFDILKSLNLDENIEEKKEDKSQNFEVGLEKKENEELIDLINTITTNELIKKKEDDIDPLDILTDLKGDENTVVVGGASSSEDLSETNPIMTLEEADKIKPTIMDEKTADLSSTLQFTQSDFDDFNDLKKEVRSSKALIYVIIGIVSIIVIIGLIVFIKKFLSI